MTTANTPEDSSTTSDATTTQEGQALRAEHVPVPPSGVRGADAVDAMDNAPGHGTTTGADGDTGAREQLRKDLGERAASTGTEEGDDLEQGAALGATDDPEGGSIQPDGARP
jgi:hypothetical protein